MSAPGSNTERLVEIMARLRAPDGCPWDREQTHATLKPFLLEEAYELLEAIDSGSDRELIGELGDVLLQVVFHARIAAEEKRFTIDDVAAAIADKLVRRHPHVFGSTEVEDADEVVTNWERIKRAERKVSREHPVRRSTACPRSFRRCCARSESRRRPRRRGSTGNMPGVHSTRSPKSSRSCAGNWGRRRGSRVPSDQKPAKARAAA